MMNILKSFFTKIYELLPGSPFQAFFSGHSEVLSDILGWLNWFIPFDLCFKLTELWVASIAIYYLFVVIKKVILDLVIAKILS